MEERDRKSICLMLDANLETGVDISTIIDDDDVESFERDSHVTVFYGPPSEPINHKEILGDIHDILEDDFIDFMEFLKSGEDFRTEDYFELGSFENPECDFLVLKLLEGNIVSDTLRLLQKSLTKKYDIMLSFSVFRPHLTLAKLRTGAAIKYLSSDSLKKLIEYSTVSFEDFTYSEGYETDKWKKFNLTSNHVIDRHFRLQDKKKACDEMGLRW